MIYKFLPSRLNEKRKAKNQKRLGSLLLMMFSSLTTLAQESDLDNKLNDTLRGGDKFYAVIAVLVTIFTILIAYLIYQDIRLKRIEKEINSKSKK